MNTLTADKHSADKMLLYAENHHQVIIIPCSTLRARSYVTICTCKFAGKIAYTIIACFFAWQSISGGRSFAEILFGETTEHDSDKGALFLRGCSLHKVCNTVILLFPYTLYYALFSH